MSKYLKKTIQTVFPVLLLMGASWSGAETHQATGFKVGEVDQNSAIVWTRCTEKPERISSDSSCPGSNGYVRVRYSTDPGLAGAITTAWEQVVVTNDYTYQFALTNLTPDQTYYLATDTDNDGVPSFPDGSLTGRFHTAASATQRMDVVFTVITGTRYDHRGNDEVDGFNIHASINNMDPNFIIPTGDTEYFDTTGLYDFGGETGISDEATNAVLARYRWNRHFALPRTLELYKTVPAYWCVDDHDILTDDAWPGSVLTNGGTLTFAEGVKIFKEQVPLNDGLTYRTKRWGKDLQIWMTEGRLYRDESNIGPGDPTNYPTMWGETQKQWFKDTVAANDATWKVLISPTPFIGPDYKRRGDNYAYFRDPRTYDYEGQELRDFMQATVPADMFVVCGDRHWQYHAIDPTSKLHEFSCGPASDKHTYQGTDLDPAYHSFHYDTDGGFASVTVTNEPNLSTITFKIHNEAGTVRHSWSKDALMPGDDALGSMTISGVTRDTNFKLQLGETSNDHIHVTGDLDLGDPTDDADAANVRQTDLLLSILPGEALLRNPYTLITYTGSLIGSFARVTGLPENAFLDYSTPGQIDLVLETSIEVSTNSVDVPEGDTANFGVRLMSQPAAETTVTVSRLSGDSDLTVQSGAVLTFSTNNWMDWQYPVLAAAEDIDWSSDSAVIRCLVEGMDTQDVTAIEIDDDGAFMEVSTSSVDVPEGDTINFGVRFTDQPDEGATVTVSRLSGDTDLTVQSGATLTFTAGNWMDWQYPVLAAAEDIDWSSDPAVFRCTAPGLNTQDVSAVEVDDDGAFMEVSTNSVDVPEGSTTNFGVRFTDQPDEGTTVTVSRLSGDTDLTVQSGATLTFTAGNWMDWQYPVLAAAEDIDWSSDPAVFRCTAPGLNTQDVSAVEVDDDGAFMEVSTNSVDVPEGSTTNFGVRFTDQPDEGATVTVSRLSGDTDLTVQSGATLTFTAGNWMDWQYPVLAAAEDIDWSSDPAVFRCTAPGLNTQDVAVVEIENDSDPTYVLPWDETFESGSYNAGALGDLDGQFGWTVSGDGSATVQNSEVRSGSQALTVSNATPAHTFAGNASNIWVTLWAKPVPGDVPTNIPSDASAVFYVGTNGHIMAYNSTSPVKTSGAVSNGWNQIELDCDYATQVWNLELNGSQVVSNFAFYGSPAAFQGFELAAESTNALFYADDIRVSDVPEGPDTDGDGIPDEWETQYYGGPTNANPSATCANGINTVLEAYVAGINPTNANARFEMSELSSSVGPQVIYWDGVSGRVYTVYWTSNLLDGFQQPLQTGIPWTSSVFTDDTHNAEGQGFYRIEVDLED